MAECHPNRAHRALGLCDTCYRREIYRTRRRQKLLSQYHEHVANSKCTIGGCGNPSDLDSVLCSKHRAESASRSLISYTAKCRQAERKLGGKCTRYWTGECKGRFEFDHINNDGFKERINGKPRRRTAIAREIIAMEHPEEKWQLLCNYHNRTKHYWEPLELRQEISRLKDLLAKGVLSNA